MKSTLDQIADMKDKVGSVPYNLRSAFVNVRALQGVRDERKKGMLFSLCEHPAPTPLVIGNSVSHPFGFISTNQFIEYTTIQSTLALYESTDEWREAEAAIQPLLDEIARLEAQHAEEVALKASKANALRDAEEAAIERAKQAALADPAVVAARKALEALDAPAPATRKGKEPQAVS